MRANGKKTGEGAASAVCTCKSFQIYRNCPDKTYNIREFDERLGAICGLGCGLWNTRHGLSAGSCASGYNGNCSYTCNDGSWTQTDNSCRRPPYLRVVVTGPDTLDEFTTGKFRAQLIGNVSGSFTVDWGATGGTLLRVSEKTTAWFEAGNGETMSVTAHAKRGGLKAHNDPPKIVDINQTDLPLTAVILDGLNTSPYIGNLGSSTVYVTFDARVSGTATGVIGYDWKVTGEGGNADGATDKATLRVAIPPLDPPGPPYWRKSFTVTLTVTRGDHSVPTSRTFMVDYI